MRRLLFVLISLLPVAAFAGTIPLLHVGLVSSPSSSPNLVTPVFSSFSAVSGTANNFGGVIGGQNIPSFAASGASNLPLPFAGAVGNLYASLNNATSTHAGAIVGQINSVSGTVTCVFSSSVNGQCIPTGTPSTSFSQGDYIRWGLIANGDSWSQTSVGRIGYTITAASGQHAVAFSRGPGVGTTGTTYQSVGNGPVAVSSTELNVSDISPTGFTVVGLWVLSSSAENTVPHTVTVCKNNSVSACAEGVGIFTTTTPSSTIGGCGTIAASGTLQGGSGCGQVNLNSGVGLHFAVGDTISLRDDCGNPTGGTCINLGLEAALDIIPDTVGEAPVFAQNTGPTGGSSNWWGVSDGATGTTQVGYQVVPNIIGHVTFSKLIACTATNPGGTATRPVAFQSGANPTTLPTTGSGPAVTLSVANGACPGANAAFLLGGFQDTTNTLALVAGQTIDTLTLGVGSPALPGVTKTSYVAVVGP